MAFLVVASIEIPVSTDGADCTYQEIGDRSRAFNGAARATILARKRTWTVRTGHMSIADANALKAALRATPTVTASGDWIGGSVTVWASVTRETPVATVPARVSLSFVLDEA